MGRANVNGRSKWRQSSTNKRPAWIWFCCRSNHGSGQSELLAVTRLVQAVGERRIAEIRKSAAAGRDVERSVAAVRHLSLPRRPAHRHHGLGHGGDALGDVPKAVDLAGCDVERQFNAIRVKHIRKTNTPTRASFRIISFTPVTTRCREIFALFRATPSGLGSGFETCRHRWRGNRRLRRARYILCLLCFLIEPARTVLFPKFVDIIE